MPSSEKIRPICFMVMPFNEKTVVAGEKTVKVDFNALWDKVLYPFIDKDLDYVPIRADQDLGALIINDMIERLVHADLVIADITMANSNVYYEIGVRHAAKEKGCVLIAANWAKAAFDIDQMRHIPYPLGDGPITDESALLIREALKTGVKNYIDSRTPVYDLIDGYPTNISMQSARSFTDQVEKLNSFSTAVRLVRMQSGKERKNAALQLIDNYRDSANTLPSIALELVYVLRDNKNWEEMMDFINGLPKSISKMPVIREQYNLGQAKTGDILGSIAALEMLIKELGDTSERSGLIGGRYKSLFYQDTTNKRYLNKAIEAFSRGMNCNLNDYYPSANIPRLLLRRKGRGDEQLAKGIAFTCNLACENTLKGNPDERWAILTQLGLAFDMNDTDKIKEIADFIGVNDWESFYLSATMPDLQFSIDNYEDGPEKDALQELYNEIAESIGYNK